MSSFSSSLYLYLSLSLSPSLCLCLSAHLSLSLYFSDPLSLLHFFVRDVVFHSSRYKRNVRTYVRAFIVPLFFFFLSFVLYDLHIVCTYVYIMLYTSLYLPLFFPCMFLSLYLSLYLGPSVSWYLRFLTSRYKVLSIFLSLSLSLCLSLIFFSLISVSPPIYLCLSRYLLSGTFSFTPRLCMYMYVCNTYSRCLDGTMYSLDFYIFTGRL